MCHAQCFETSFWGSRRIGYFRMAQNFSDRTALGFSCSHLWLLKFEARLWLLIEI